MARSQDITTGRFSNNDDEASIVLATTTGSQTTVSVFGLDEDAEQNTFVSEANFTLSLNLPQANGVTTRHLCTRHVDVSR